MSTQDSATTSSVSDLSRFSRVAVDDTSFSIASDASFFNYNNNNTNDDIFPIDEEEGKNQSLEKIEEEKEEDNNNNNNEDDVIIEHDEHEQHPDPEVECSSQPHQNPVLQAQAQQKDDTNKSDWWPDENDISFMRFVLTERLSDFKFSSVWKAMSLANWTYNCRAGYISPSEFETLDWFVEDGKIKTILNTNPPENKKRIRTRSTTGQQQAQNWPVKRFEFTLANELVECLEGKKEYSPTHASVIDPNLYKEPLEKLHNDILKVLFILERRENPGAYDNNREQINNKSSIHDEEISHCLEKDDYIMASPKLMPKDGSQKYFQKKTASSTKKKLNPHGRNLRFRNKKDNYTDGNVPHEKEEENVEIAQKMLLESAELHSPKLIVDKLKKEMKAKNHMDQIEFLEESYTEKQYEEWKFLLQTSHSLLFYGFGSKTQVLDDFAEHVLSKEGDVLILNGYDPDINICEIIDLIEYAYVNGNHNDSSALLGTTTRASELPIDCPKEVKRAAIIGRQLRSRKLPIYILIHNIDGQQLRNDIAQRSLSTLVSQSSATENSPRTIRLLASVDHINASSGLLWDPKTLSDFAWIWKSLTTFRPYFKELSKGEILAEQIFDNKSKSQNMLVQKGGKSTMVGLSQILESLAPKHAEVLLELAALQIESHKKTNRNDSSLGGKQRNNRRKKDSELFVSVTYNELKDKCQQKMFVSSDANLRAVIREMSDHDIVETKRDNGGVEVVWIKGDYEALEQIVNYELLR